MKTKLVNDKRCLSIVNYQLSILLLLAAMLLAGCSKDTPADNPDDPSNPVNVVMQSAALTGLVKDASGIPLSGVKVTTGSLNATTGKDGTFSFTQAGTVDSVAVVKFEKTGYFTLTRSGDQADAMYIEAMMYPTGNSNISLQTTFDASAAKSLQAGGVTIDLPAGCMTKADGSAYSGTVRADVLYLAPDNANAAAVMPGGDLTCIRSNNSKEMLLPFGIMDVVFTDNSGNLLKIKDKTNVQISFPAPSGATDASVPQWTFNEAKGVWVEDGTLTLKGSSYTGAVNHFSPRAGGKSRVFTTISAQVLVCNKPQAGVPVKIEFDKYFEGDVLRPSVTPNGVTDGSGYCTMKHVYTGENITVTATYNDKTQSQDIPFSEADKSGLHSVVLNFDDGCGDQIPEVCAVKYHIDYEDASFTSYLSWDNYGKRWRDDSQADTGDDVVININDNITRTAYHYEYDGDKKWRTSAKPEDWDVWSIENNDKSAIMLYQVGMSNFTIHVEYNGSGEELVYSNLNGYAKHSNTETILGKECNVWENKLTGTVIWEWKKVILLRTVNGKVTFQILSITDNVPVSAFTNQSVVPFWIE